MAEERRVWEKRVSEWRASGLKLAEFVAGREYSAGSLRYWVGRLKENGDSGPHVARPVELARVVRAGERDASTGSLVLEVGPARVWVGPGIDPSTLRTVLEVLRAVEASRTP